MWAHVKALIPHQAESITLWKLWCQFKPFLPPPPTLFFYLLPSIHPQSDPSPPGSCPFLRMGWSLAVFISTGWPGAQAHPRWGTSRCKSESCPAETGERTPVISHTTRPPGPWKGSHLLFWCRHGFLKAREQVEERNCRNCLNMEAPTHTSHRPSYQELGLSFPGSAAILLCGVSHSPAIFSFTCAFKICKADFPPSFSLKCHISIPFEKGRHYRCFFSPHPLICPPHSLRPSLWQQVVVVRDNLCRCEGLWVLCVPFVCHKPSESC